MDGPFDSKKHKLAVTSYTYGDFQDCLKGAVPENTVRGGTPTLSRINEAGQDDALWAGWRVPGRRGRPRGRGQVNGAAKKKNADADFPIHESGGARK